MRVVVRGFSIPIEVVVEADFLELEKYQVTRIIIRSKEIIPNVLRDFAWPCTTSIGCVPLNPSYSIAFVAYAVVGLVKSLSK